MTCAYLAPSAFTADLEKMLRQVIFPEELQVPKYSKVKSVYSAYASVFLSIASHL